jgi:hypothetical protein
MPLDLQAFRDTLPISQQGQESLDHFRRLLVEFGEGSVTVDAVVVAHDKVPRLKLTPADHGHYALVLLIEAAAIAAATQRRRPSRRQEEENENDDDPTTTTIIPWLEIMTESFLRTVRRCRDFPTVLRPFFRDNNVNSNNNTDAAATVTSFDILAAAIQKNPFGLPHYFPKMTTSSHDDDEPSSSNKSWLLLFSYFAVRFSDDLKIDGDDDDDDEIGEEIDNGATKPPMMIILDELLSSVLYYREAAALVQMDNFLLHPFRATNTLITAWSQHVAPAPSPRYVLELIYFFGGGMQGSMFLPHVLTC